MALYDYTPDLNPLDDEEERKRREREAIAARMDEEAYANQAMAPVAPDFGSVVGQAFDKRIGAAQDRINQVGQMFTDPATAFQQRILGEQAQAAQDEAANTEVKSQTIKTYGDGSQERVVKTQVPAGQAQAQMGPMGPIMPGSPEAQQQTEQFAQAMARAQQQQQAQARAPSLTTPIPGMPETLPAQGEIPVEAAQVRPQIAQPIQPGAGVQVAGPAVMPRQAPVGVAAAPGASLAQAGQVAQAQAPAQPLAQPVAAPPATPAWVQAANDAGTDLSKLFDVAAKYPESRSMIMEKTKLAVQNKTKEDEAAAIMKAAQEGDLKAMNKIQQAIKPETGKPKEEVTVNDYLKAVLYKRLGLDALAADVQNKIIGKDTKFSQVSLGGSNWEVETNSSGQIIRAKDNEGNFATTDTLNKLRAGGVKAGTQATAFAGGIHTVPNAQGTGVDLVMPTQNAITGQAGFTYASGPNQGKPYVGTATPQPQSVGTSFQKALDKAMIDFRTSPSTAGAKAAMDKAYVLDPGDGSVIRAVQANINANAPDIFNQIKTYSPSGAVSEQLPGAGGAPAVASPEVARVQRDIESIQKEIARKPSGDPQREAQRQATLQKELADRQAWMSRNGGGVATGGATAGGSLAQRESNIKIGQAVAEARQKPAAEAAGKIEAKDINNQNFANETYGLIKPIADLIKQSTGSGIGAGVDKLAGLIGASTSGAQAIAQLEPLVYPILANVPRFEGPQSEYDVKTYQKAAGDFANAEKPIATRLAALQGLITLLKKYDKAGTNDWTYGSETPSTGIKIIKREKVQ